MNTQEASTASTRTPTRASLNEVEAALCSSRTGPHQLGKLGETYVALWLESLGWQLLERNWSTRYGELDLVTIDPQECLVFMEVKTRRSRTYGLPEEAVAASKQSKLRHAAAQWLISHGRTPQARHQGTRFDVAAVSVGPPMGGKVSQARIKLIKGAF
ncbi:UPF0102 protein [Bombiscardovia nodaiensis]|uniref:UPF0102 protein KIM372_07490 n=1 Tax=Bombiscardovia nodaiensis TaxID=2932181 RepID=A0ABM8B7J3_9BIFI|nr:UPF0102 protein [Bombiscardovia nodaiensis]